MPIRKVIAIFKLFDRSITEASQKEPDYNKCLYSLLSLSAFGSF